MDDIDRILEELKSEGEEEREVIERAMQMTNADICYECQGLGDDYYFDENGELISACEDCPFNDWEA